MRRGVAGGAGGSVRKRKCRDAGNGRRERRRRRRRGDGRRGVRGDPAWGEGGRRRKWRNGWFVEALIEVDAVVGAAVDEGVSRRRLNHADRWS